MTKWKIVYIKQVQKDVKKIAVAGLKSKVEKLLSILKVNPFKNPPEHEKLAGDLTGAYLRRINIQHRLIHQVYPKEKTVKIIRMWTHYE